MTPDEVLDGAADLIKEHGLAHGELHDARGRFCAVGAINFVVNGDPEWADGTWPVRQILRAEVGCGGISVWSDRHLFRRNVVKGLRRAAERARNLEVST